MDPSTTTKKSKNSSHNKKAGQLPRILPEAMDETVVKCTISNAVLDCSVIKPMFSTFPLYFFSFKFVFFLFHLELQTKKDN